MSKQPVTPARRRPSKDDRSRVAPYVTGDANTIDFRRRFEVFHSDGCVRVTGSTSRGSLAVGRYVAAPGYTVWRRHGQEDWQLMYSVAGQGRLGPPPNPMPIPAGQAVLIPPGVPFDYGIADGVRRWEQFGVQFQPRPAWYPLLRWPVARFGTLSLQITDPWIRRRILARLADAIRVGKGRMWQRYELVVNAVEEVLLWCELQKKHTQLVTMDPRVRQVMEFLDSHLDTNASVADLAGQVGVTRPRLCQLFGRDLHVTPREFLEQRRIERACELLDHGELSIGEVAREVGFNDAFYFSKRFRRALGKSPREYRQGRRVRVMSGEGK